MVARRPAQHPPPATTTAARRPNAPVRADALLRADAAPAAVPTTTATTPLTSGGIDAPRATPTFTLTQQVVALLAMWLLVNLLAVVLVRLIDSGRQGSATVNVTKDQARLRVSVEDATAERDGREMRGE